VQYVQYSLIVTVDVKYKEATVSVNKQLLKC